MKRTISFCTGPLTIHITIFYNIVYGYLPDKPCVVLAFVEAIHQIWKVTTDIVQWYIVVGLAPPFPVSLVRVPVPSIP